jgi:SAM-dependent methyltransferase
MSERAGSSSTSLARQPDPTVLRPNFIDELHCPFCGSGLAIERVLASSGDDIEHGVVRCGCYRYPVLDGILVLKQQSGPADTHDALVSLLLAGEIEQARHRAMHVDAPLAAAPRDRWHRMLQHAATRGVPLAGRLSRLHSKRSNERQSGHDMAFADLLKTLRPGLYAQYLYQRYANNSFLASVAPLLLLGDLTPGQRVLELACGIGHSAYLIQSLFPHLQLVATDHDYVNLSIARRHFVPGAQLVCLDAEAPLPFEAKSFGAVFCLDGFHYLRSKVALISELNHVTEPLALWLFPHLHNALCENFNAGIPLDPEHYARCFAEVPHRIFSESALLGEFHREGTLRLDRCASADELAQAPNLTLIGTRRQDFWHKRADLALRLAARPSTLIVNPIYHIEADGSAARLSLSWPSARLRAECLEVENYLPSSSDIDARLLQRLHRDEISNSDLPVVQELARKFLLVNLPLAAYARS